jgi:hypothetical protein
VSLVEVEALADGLAATEQLIEAGERSVGSDCAALVAALLATSRRGRAPRGLAGAEDDFGPAWGPKEFVERCVNRLFGG